MLASPCRRVRAASLTDVTNCALRVGAERAVAPGCGRSSFLDHKANHVVGMIDGMITLRTVNEGTEHLRIVRAFEYGGIRTSQLAKRAFHLLNG